MLRKVRLGREMRVLFVTPYYAESWQMGGMALCPAEWAQTLMSYGVDVDVITTTANGKTDLDVPLGVPIKHNGIEVTHFPRLRQSGNLFVSLPLLIGCKKAIPTYDVVHSIGLWTFPSIVSSIIAKQSRIPYCISLHGTLMPWAYNRHNMRKKLFMRLFEKNRIANASSIICSSILEKHHFQQLEIPGRADVISNVIPDANDDVQERRSRFRSHYNLQDKTVLLFAGRVVRNKGLHLTISAFQNVVDKYPSAQLVVVGPFEDSAGQLAQEQVAALGLDMHVRFLGAQGGDDYWDAVSGADLFVLNSYSENFGMAPAEALSCGVPVLLSDQVGIADLVLRYEAGMVTRLDVEAITEAMDLLLADMKKLRRMGQNGIRLAQEHFSSSAVGQQFVTLLEEAVREKKTNSL